CSAVAAPIPDPAPTTTILRCSEDMTTTAPMPGTTYRMLDSKPDYKSLWWATQRAGPAPGRRVRPGVTRRYGTEEPHMSMPIVDDAAKVLADPAAYADEARLHAALSSLRANAPVSLVDVPPYKPFWAITKHADVMAVERANQVFTNWPRPVLMPAASDEMQAAVGIKTLIHMDDPQHRIVRAIAADWFSPKSMRAMGERIEQLAVRYVDQMR